MGWLETMSVSQKAIDRKISLEEFVGTHEGSLFRFLEGLVGSKQAASELLEKSFVAALRTGVLSAELAEGRVVLFRAAFRAAKEYLAAGLLVPEVPVAEPVEAQRESVEEAIRRLPFDYRAIFILRDILSFTRSDAAHICGLEEEEGALLARRARLMVRRLFLRIIVNDNGESRSVPVQVDFFEPQVRN